MTATFTTYYNNAYQVSSTWNTLIDESFSGNEQRRNQWTNSHKSWVLNFEKTPSTSAEVMAFFDARKGKYEAFNWTWATNKGGDGVTYLVRFDTDSLNMDSFLGYTTFSLKIVQVNS